MYDFHTHTFLSDGELLPIELIRRAVVNGYTALGLTDHASAGNLRWVLEVLQAECRLAERHMPIRALPGVELTHVPPEAIAELAKEARALGAQLVLVHGETPVEPVAPGTNLAAVTCPDVDVLAHPGLLTPEVAELAAHNGVFLEVSSHRGHCLGNGRVVQEARRAGARLLVNSDTHSPDELLTEDMSRRVALGAGLSEEELQTVLTTNPQALLAQG